ncbi:MAG TPA: peptidylprolyl isomerase [Candidatus Solibacter sp.]|nr:peptidylprolyl isomerase [Candidatus Solibacter sp.]
MRRRFLIVAGLMCAVSVGFAQSGTEAQKNAAKPSTAAKPAAAAKPAVHPAVTKPTAIIDTTAGKMTCTLFPDKAPIGVENFIGLANGTKDWKNPVSGASKHGVPLYDGTIFHRVIPGFMIQGGDPAGNGSGDPGYKFKNETSPDLLFDQPGRLAYANAGPGTNGSQFFITEVATPHLNGGYTIFGQCDEATVALVKQIAHMATDPSNDKPFRPVKINHITILKPGAAAKPAAAKPAGAAPAKKPSAAAPNTPSSSN